MTVVLEIWLGVSALLATGAMAAKVGPVHRAIGGALLWPSFPFLIAVSRYQYGRRHPTLLVNKKKSEN